MVDKELVNSLIIQQGCKIVLLYNAAMAMGGRWDDYSDEYCRSLYVEVKEAFLKDYVKGGYFLVQQSKRAWYIYSDYPSGWQTIGRNYWENNETAFYRTHTSGGKGVILTYDPLYYTEGFGEDLFKRVIGYVTDTEVVEPVVVPEGNVAFVIYNFDDQTPGLTDRESNVRAKLLELGYSNITYISSARVWVSDMSKAKFIIATEHPVVDKELVNSLIIQQERKVVLLYNAAMCVGGDWSNGSYEGSRSLYVEAKEAFLKDYVKGAYFLVQQSNYAWYIYSDYPLGWHTIGRNYWENNETAFCRTDTSGGRGAVLTYDPLYYNSAGEELFGKVISWTAQQPQVVISPRSLDFGSVKVGSSKALTLTILNSRDADLQVENVGADNSVFGATPTSFVLAPDSSRQITATFAPSAIGPETGTLTISTDSPEQSTIAVLLSGVGIEEGVAGKGDVNGDGEINILDIVKIVNHITEQETLSEGEFARADVAPFGAEGQPQGDGAVNIFDIVGIVDMILHPENHGASAKVALARSVPSRPAIVRLYEVKPRLFSLDLKSEVPISGLQLRLSYDPQEAKAQEVLTTEGSSGMILSWRAGEGKLIALLYSPDGKTITSGDGPVLQVRFCGKVTAFSVEEVVLSDPGANPVPVSIQTGLVSVEAGSEYVAAKPDDYALFQSHPNPTNAGTSINYALPEEGRVRLEVYNIVGQLVRVLVDGTEGPGYNAVFWDGRDEKGREVSSGIYLYRLKTGKFEAVRRMVILK